MVEFNNSNLDDSQISENEKEKKDDFKKDLENRVEKYEDVSGISTKRLDFGLWYVERRKYFRAGFSVFLILIAVLTWGYTSYNFIYYYTIGIKQDEQMVREITVDKLIGHDYLVSLSPTKLLISGAESLRNSSGNYDIFAKVQNENEKYMANFSYCFMAGGVQVECKDDFVLPGASKYVMALNKEVQSGAYSVDFLIRELDWKKIDPHTFPSWDSYKQSRLNIDVSDIKFTPPSSSGLSEKLEFNILKFNVENNTAYNYWAVPLNIVIFGGGRVSAVNQYTVTELMSGESREVTMSWSGNFGSASEVLITPELNILKNDIYIDYKGDPLLEK